MSKAKKRHYAVVRYLMAGVAEVTLIGKPGSMEGMWIADIQKDIELWVLPDGLTMENMPVDLILFVVWQAVNEGYGRLN